MSQSLLYTSMASLQTNSTTLSMVAQNIANANTTGYAAAQQDALAVPYVGTNPIGGADVITRQEQIDTAPGPLQRTGGPLDVAVAKGWLVVQQPNGKPALTRAGALSISNNGILVTQSGDPVLNAGLTPISLPAGLGAIKIARDGSISGVPAGASPTQSKVYGRLYVAATPTSLKPIGNSLYQDASGAGPAPAADPHVEQGYLEGSNVNPITAMTQMISASRAFQMQTQSVNASGKTQAALDQLLQS